MSASVSPAKVCQICRKDVTGIKRVKDPKGNYYCGPCYAARQQAGATAPQEAAPGASVDAAPVEPATKSCPGCQAAMSPDAVFCVSCGYNLRMGKRAATSVSKATDWGGLLAKVPTEVFLLLGGIVLFVLIGLGAPLFTTSTFKVCTVSLFIIMGLILTVGSRKCRRILVDEYGWSETLFRIPFLRNFVFLGGLISAPKLWLVTIRHAAAAVLFAIAAFFMLPHFVHSDPEARDLTLGSSHAARASQVSHSAEFAAPPAFTKTESGVEVAQLTCDGPNHQQRELWIYRPKGSKPDHSLPCVFITTGNFRMIFGTMLNEDQSEDFESYAKEGFVVAAYSLDGEIEEGKDGESDEETLNMAARAIKAFKASHGGIANAEVAIQYVLHNVPEVDGDRLYAFGSGSGGSVALRLAASEPQIKAVGAWGPVADAMAGHDASEADLTRLQEPIPDILDFIQEVSPVRHVSELHCPVYIYQPGFDILRMRSSVEAYCQTLKDAGVSVTYRLGPTDLQSAEKETVAPDIEWLRSVKNLPKPAAVASSAPAPEAATVPATTPEAAPATGP